MNEVAILLVQIVLIIVSGRILAGVCRYFGQPPVVGEIAAGICLGPTIFGRLAPDTFASAFPLESIPSLLALSQLGLVFFMFLVGLEFAPEIVNERRRSVVVISHASIVVPFVLGTALALYLYPRMSDRGVTFTAFALFLGISMSVTAFPVLARILADRGLTHTRLGNTVIACAAVDDVTAWCVLAFVVVIARATAIAPLFVHLAFLVVYMAAMIWVVRPLLRRLAAAAVKRASSEAVLAAVVILVLISATVTELLGIHALFGAFVAGAILPREEKVVEALSKHIRGLTSVVFLPLFFAVTGLRTNVGLVNTTELWMICGLILLVAIAGKLGGALFSARAVGMPWRDAATIGVLMNTRGLMEMVVLNIGLEIGVISRGLFTMIVLMALITTAMTTPLIDRLMRREQEEMAVSKLKEAAA
jgi:Kef-type K+ transport system membrane component KefB